MKLRSSAIVMRAGRETAAVSIGLFLLSLCAVAFVFIWFMQDPKQVAESDAYRFAKPQTATPEIRTWHHIDGFPAAISQMETVFWEPNDTDSLRAWLKESGRLKGADVLEIGCGTGLVAIACALQGAHSVIASDINPAAVINATYNAELCGVSSRVKVRQVNTAHPGPFEVIASDEKFDLIVSNPPWEDAPVDSPAAYAFYDPGFKLLDGILAEAQNHLKADGYLLLAYGAKKAIARLQEQAPKLGWEVKLCDDRDLTTLPEVFLPGMLLELQRIAPHATQELPPK